MFTLAVLLIIGGFFNVFVNVPAYIRAIGKPRKPLSAGMGIWLVFSALGWTAVFILAAIALL